MQGQRSRWLPVGREFKARFSRGDFASLPDFEIRGLVELAGGRVGVEINSVHPGRAGAAMNEIHRSQNRGFLSHEEGFDPAIGQIAHEARHAERDRMASRRLAKEHALDSASDEHVCSELFHVRLVKASIRNGRALFNPQVHARLGGVERKPTARGYGTLQR